MNGLAVEHVLLALLHAAFSVFLTAAVITWGVRTPRRVLRTALFAGLLAPLFVFNGVFMMKAVELRFAPKIDAAPWILSIFVFAANVLCGAWTWRQAQSRALRTLPLVVAASVALLAEVITFEWLDRRASTLAGDLIARGDTIVSAHEASTTLEANETASAYQALMIQVHLMEAVGKLDEWDEITLSGEELPADDPRLRKGLETLGPVLDAARPTAALPSCSFPIGVGSAPHGDDMPFDAMRSIVGALVLDARVRSSEGDFDGALLDLVTVLGMARHLAGTRNMEPLTSASLHRTAAIHGLMELVSRDGISPAQLIELEAQVDPFLGDRFVDRAPNAIELQEAFGVRWLGCVASGAQTTDVDLYKEFGIPTCMYRVFLFTSDVRGYQRIMRVAEQFALRATGRVLVHEDASASIVDSWRAGLLRPSLAFPITMYFQALEFGDAKARLASVAIQAARHRAASGRYPMRREDLMNLPMDLTVEGDGEWIRLVDTRPGFAELPQIELPPNRQAATVR